MVRLRCGIENGDDMSQIYINLSEVRNANYEMPSLASKADNAKRAVGLMRYRIPTDVAERYNIKQRLGDVYLEISKIEAKIDELYAVTNSCVEQYARAEQINSNNIDAFQ